MSEIIPLHIEDAEVETIERNETKQHTQEEIMEILKQIQYKEGSLQWITLIYANPIQISGFCFIAQWVKLLKTSMFAIETF